VGALVTYRPEPRRKATTPSIAVSARKSSRTCASSKMEVPASIKLQVPTTCCCLPSGSAGTVVTSSARPSAPLPMVHVEEVAGDAQQADQGSGLLCARFSRWCESQGCASSSRAGLPYLHDAQDFGRVRRGKGGVPGA
jgi:hypothetical protein